MQRVALVLQYLGTHFHGWQRQPNHRSVQEELESTITAIVQHPVTVHGAGRTDSGVHAAAQVAHFQTSSPIPAQRWAAVLNTRLPEDVMVRTSVAVAADWHARFSAVWRRYRYTLYTDPCPNLFLKPYTWHYYHRPLDTEQMLAALQSLVGRQHLSAFHRAGSQRRHSWVDVQEVVCQRRPTGMATDPLIEIEVQASGFLYGMMRLLVGLLVQVGDGTRSLADFLRIWQTERRDEVKHSAPAKGLCLLKVGYPESPFAPEVWFDAMPHFSLTPIPLGAYGNLVLS
jgi:tRNA pseudouridine38-40 synthase